MAFSRALAPAEPPHADALTSAMVGIGMNFAARPAVDPNIEDTLLFASIEGMENNDLRVLAVLVTWFGIHHHWVNADRLIKLVAAQRSPRVRAVWSALATWQSTDRRFQRLIIRNEKSRTDLLATGTDFHIARHGEDPRFAKTALRVPAGILRDREADVLTPEQLAQRHSHYRYRIMMGPSYRADMWAILERKPDLSAAELARCAYGSFATAWRAKRDFELLRGPAVGA